MEYTKNTKSLEELLKKEGTDKDYADFMGVLKKVVLKLYGDYNFLRQDPLPEDYESGHCLIFQFYKQEFPQEYDYLFKLAIDKGLEDGEITKRFIKFVKEGNLIPLGNVHVEDIGTGVSSILQATDVRILITFMPNSMKEIRDEKRKELEEKKKELQKQQEVDAEIQRSALQNLKEADQVLTELKNKAIEANDLQEQFTKTKDLFYGG